MTRQNPAYALKKDVTHKHDIHNKNETHMGIWGNTGESSVEKSNNSETKRPNEDGHSICFNSKEKIRETQSNKIIVSLE